MTAGAVPILSARVTERDEPSLDDVVRALEADILFGRLRPRERLVEDQLLHRFPVKRHVIRQALVELERAGIVVRALNRGAAVRDFSAEEVEEVAEIRAVLQRRAAERMTLPAPASFIAKLEALQTEHDAAVDSRNPHRIDAANEAFHGAIFDACGNGQLAAAIARYAYLSRAMRLYPMIDPPLLETLRGEHWQMIAALRSGDRAELMRLVVDHIQHSKQRYLAARGAAQGEP
jgi:DNA-binding GntR family transcriptional regulator